MATHNVGELYAARFAEDGKFYPVEILKHEEEGRVRIKFLAFDNQESVDTAGLRVLSVESCDCEILKPDQVEQHWLCIARFPADGLWHKAKIGPLGETGREKTIHVIFHGVTGKDAEARVRFSDILVYLATSEVWACVKEPDEGKTRSKRDSGNPFVAQVAPAPIPAPIQVLAEEKQGGAGAVTRPTPAQRRKYGPFGKPNSLTRHIARVDHHEKQIEVLKVQFLQMKAEVAQLRAELKVALRAVVDAKGESSGKTTSEGREAKDTLYTDLYDDEVGTVPFIHQKPLSFQMAGPQHTRSLGAPSPTSTAPYAATSTSAPTPVTNDRPKIQKRPTSLDECIDTDNGEIAQQLLQAHADPACVLSNGQTLLHRAAENDAHRVAALLLEARANPWKRDLVGRLPSELCPSGSRFEQVLGQYQNIAEAEAENSALAEAKKRRKSRNRGRGRKFQGTRGGWSGY